MSCRFYKMHNLRLTPPWQKNREKKQVDVKTVNTLKQANATK